MRSAEPGYTGHQLRRKASGGWLTWLLDCSLFSPGVLSRELAGGQSRAPPSTVGTLISCAPRGPVWVMSQPALELYREESPSASAGSLRGQTQLPPNPAQLRELGPNELEPRAFA
ncbi:unnamed protein product [Rangifer tarandus platyrhynchus]|uniref:Uncharacterized protein n=3 Tax=Rangifer tarandus platyrhynchus TaxID=3082113 RepID=A0ABN8YL98_RANTA|nr:unnamed protein product [Rangifer tarandus platyrhynchus]CAI9696795.1 unnamed protein product [Rangifer tarandus platyrhynchus]